MLDVLCAAPGRRKNTNKKKRLSGKGMLTWAPPLASSLACKFCFSFHCISVFVCSTRPTACALVVILNVVILNVVIVNVVILNVVILNVVILNRPQLVIVNRPQLPTPNPPHTLPPPDPTEHGGSDERGRCTGACGTRHYAFPLRLRCRV